MTTPKKQVDKMPALAPTTEEIAQRAYEIFRAPGVESPAPTSTTGVRRSQSYRASTLRVARSATADRSCGGSCHGHYALDGDIGAAGAHVATTADGVDKGSSGTSPRLLSGRSGAGPPSCRRDDLTARRR